MPARPRPIVIIGAGGVVSTAHLPVYQRLKFPVAGIYDINPDASRDTASRFGVSTVFSTLAEAAGRRRCYFRPRRARRPDRGRVEGVAARFVGAHSEADGRRSRRGTIDSRHLPRARSRRRDEFSAAVQPQRARASRSPGRPPARGDRRHRSAAGRQAAVAPMEISRAGAAPRDSLPLDSLPRLDTGLGGRASRRVLPRRCASVHASSFRTRAARSFSITATRCAARCCSTTRISSNGRTVHRS